MKRKAGKGAETHTVRRLLVVILAVALLSAIPSLSAETRRDDKVTFNFVDVDLSAITRFISEITKKNFIFDERVKGKITIVAPTKLSVDEAYNLFTSVLELKGFTVVSSGVDAYKIIPSSEAKQRGLAITKEKQPVNESYIARLIPLRNIASDDALKFLQPLVSKDGYAAAFGPGNLLLVIDSGLNMEKILTIIESIDQPFMTERPEIVFLKYASADSIAKMLNEGMGRRMRGMPQPVQAEEGRAVADQRLNAIIIFGDRNARESMKSLIALIDTPSREAQGRINVCFLEHADATEMAKVLDGIIKGTQAQAQRQAPAAVGAAAPSINPFEAAGGITISVDKATNALIIVASPADYQNILQVIRQLDKRRRQVYVEAMIIEASIDKLQEVGVKWRLAATKNGEPVAIGGFGTIDSTAIAGIIQGLTGASLGGLGNFLNIPVSTTNTDGTTSTTTLTVPGFAFLLSLNDFKDAVNILSTPQILTSDNKEAEIVVGENVPFIAQRERDITTTNTVLNSIERHDVGIKLKLTPSITEGDYVRLDLYQEISAVKEEPTVVVISVGPTTTKRSTKTTVVVKDRQTVVIGGLMQERAEDNVTKMPFLGDIPVLGWLFKTTSTHREKTNLFVFITPHIIRENEMLTQITKKKEREFQVAERRYAPGELLVKFKEGVSDDAARKIISDAGAAIIKLIEGVNVYHISLPRSRGVEDAAAEFSRMPEVQYAEPNYMLKFQEER